MIKIESQQKVDVIEREVYIFAWINAIDGMCKPKNYMLHFAQKFNHSAVERGFSLQEFLFVSRNIDYGMLGHSFYQGSFLKKQSKLSVCY